MTVIPDISDISVPPIGEGMVDIRLWSPALAPANENISMSLSECGTGVGPSASPVMCGYVAAPRDHLH
jgi:hypothetical protein